MTADPRQPGDDHVRDDEAPDPTLSKAWAALKAQRARAATPEAIEALALAVDPTAEASGPAGARERALLQALEGGHADGLALAHTFQRAAREATTADALARDGGTDNGRRSSRMAAPSRWTRWRPVLLGAAVPLAAAAAVSLMVRRGGPVDEASPSAAVVRGADSALSLVAPRDGARLADTTTFRWTPVADATRYLVTWLAADGATVATATVTTPSAIMPVLDAPTRARIVAWRVEATTRDGRTMSSAFREIGTP